MATEDTASSQLADVALAIADASGLDAVCAALASERFGRDSTSATRTAIAGGNSALESCLRRVQKIWASLGRDVSGNSIALALRASVAAVGAFRRHVPSTQVVWTGPKVEGSFLRTTREVVREQLRSARSELRVVGYWIAARDDGEGIIEEVIALLADAVARRVDVSFVFDERLRPDGRDNRLILVSAWPIGVPLPRILTWRLPAGDQHLKLHAKVLVSDRRDALVTSANLTSYAMDRNMEMGVRIVGAPAHDIANHFDLLETCGILEPFSVEQSES